MTGTWTKRVCTSAALLTSAMVALAPAGAAPRQIERLDRGVVAVPAQGGGILVSWRLLATDPASTGFNLFRNGVKVNDEPLTSTNFVDTDGSASASYAIRVVVNGVQQDRAFTAPVWAAGYGTIPIQRPAAVQQGSTLVQYSAGDGTVGDLDGDGKYEIVLKWDPSNLQDNSTSNGATAVTYIDAYTMAGRRLWRINLGRNIRSGAHYTQMLVQDFDGNGRAELVVKTADGTVDGQGRVIGDANANYVNSGGHIITGPEYLTVFEGTTGRALSTVNYAAPRFPTGTPQTTANLQAIWGDNYGNRSERYNAAVAYLDGERPSIIEGRGYYARSTLSAWDFRNGQLTQRWVFDSSSPANPDYTNQGNHNLSVADVDNDGKDEIVYGSMAIDDDGRGLWSAKLGGVKLGHGDAMHVSDLDPARPGLEKFGVHEGSCSANTRICATMLDARTGEVLFNVPGTNDNGRGVAADIDPRFYGAENWSGRHPGLLTAKGQLISTAKPSQTNFVVWWDGDLTRELLDGGSGAAMTVSKWDWNAGRANTLVTFTGTTSSNGTKANPTLSGDILGDWREEVIVAAADQSSLRIYATPYSTDHKRVTLMHDPVYRSAIAWQNSAYNQPPHTGFYLGAPAPETTQQ